MAKLPTPAWIEAHYELTSTTIAWGDVPTCAGYRVYRNGTLVDTVYVAEYTDSTAVAGTSFTYSVVAIGNTWSALYPLSNLYPSDTLYPTDGTTDTDSDPITITTDNPYGTNGKQATPTIIELSQTQSSATLQINRQQSWGTMVLSRDGVPIATATPSGTNIWVYTDVGLINNREYVYSVYTLADATHSQSDTASVAVYIGQNYSLIERQIAYLETLQRPFAKLCRLRFLYPNGTTAFALDNNRHNKRSKAFIQEGSVNANMQNGQRLSATVTIANADHLYDFDLNKIWFGQEIAIDEGVVLPNGEEYWRYTGVFVIDNPNETINPDNRTVTYNLVDKWADLDGTLDGNLEGTYEVALGTNIYTPIAALLGEDRGNGRKVDYMKPVFTEYFNSRTQELPDGTTVSMVLSPYTLTVDGDGGTIGEVVLGLGGMVNAWVGYDNTGRLRIEPSQDDILDKQKAVLYRFSPEEVTLLGLAYTIKKEELFNDYIVVGEQFDDYSQPGGRAQNLDPRSDTNVNIIGRKTKRESASGYATVQQCMDLAEWRLKRSGVLQKAVNVSCSQMFHIELNSLVEIVRTDKPGNPTERHLIQGYSRPLASNGPMTITAVSTADYPMATVTEWPPAE